MYKMHYPWQVQGTERVTNNSAAAVTNISAIHCCTVYVASVSSLLFQLMHFITL
jgi:hypothetical protein